MRQLDSTCNSICVRGSDCTPAGDKTCSSMASVLSQARVGSTREHLTSLQPVYWCYAIGMCKPAHLQGLPNGVGGWQGDDILLAHQTAELLSNQQDAQSVLRSLEAVSS